MRTYILDESTNPSKKFMAIRLNPTLKYIHFGSKGSDDFTISGDNLKKRNYLLRHKPNEDWTNLDTAGAWARWLLWNKQSIDESILDMEKRFNIKIIKAF